MSRAVLIFSLLLALVGCANQPIEKRKLDAAISDLSEWQALAPVSQEELRRYLDQAEVLRERAAEYQAWLDCDSKFNSELPKHCHGPEAQRRQEARLDRVEVTGARLAAPDLITNNQVAGVDEGGIVKKFGNHLVVLRGGHLYSIAIGDAGKETLTLKDAHRVLEPGDDSTWLDELLLADGVIVLLGFNHHAEVGTLFLFRLTETGRIAPIQIFEYESDDYFDYSNYGSRIVGDELVIMTSRSIDRDTVIGLPRWRGIL